MKRERERERSVMEDGRMGIMMRVYAYEEEE